MISAMRRGVLAIVAAAGLMMAGVCFAGAPAGEPNLTFFGWSDQHVQTDGDGSHLVPAIEAMNRLPGTKYPEKIGGSVARPEFVFGCGDITEWPTVAARDTYNELVTKRLKFPALDVVGNHDEGGLSPSETIKRWIIARHDGLSYTFDRGGVHFIALRSAYDESLNSPAQPIGKEALTFLRNDLARLAKLAKPKPVIVATHLCYDAITNRDELVAALAGSKVLAVLGGHYHQSKVDRYRGIAFLQLPSPWRNGPGEFMVIRITPERLVAIPYNYREKKWSDAARSVLDVRSGAAADSSGTSGLRSAGTPGMIGD